tara:strand:- start:3610 stop:4500 length:891 start_codon:yes stop_codon:yes gene_type:complete
MKKIKFLIFILSIFLFNNCEKESYELGNLISPTDLTISASLQGSDENNPYGDGSGYVTFTANAGDAITYKFIQNGTEFMQPSGVFTTRFTNTGVHVYEIQVIASGTAGLMTSTSISVEVLYTFEPPADLLSSLTTGSWRVMAEAPAHMGVGPADDMASNGVAVWWNAGPYDKSDTAMYDDRIVFDSDGTMEYQTQGSIFGKAPPLEADFFGNQGLGAPNSDNEHPYYPADNFNSNWTVSEDDNGYLTLNFTGNGFAGFYVGGNHSYVILSRTSNEMYLKTVGSDTNGWFIKLTNQD